MERNEAAASGKGSGGLWLAAIAGALVAGATLVPPVRGWFTQAGLQWLRTLLSALGLATLLTPVMIRISFPLGWLDRPGGRKDHEGATPLLGGAAIFAAFGLALLLNYHYSWEMKGLGLAALLIWLVGVVDDRRELPASVKLLAQFAAVGVLFAFDIHVTFLPPGPAWDLSEYAITLLWVVGIMNAVNFLDGMDGLAVGMGAIIAAALAVVALQSGQPYFAFVAMALLGALAGFLPFNFRRGPARIFLGDNGATTLGFLLAAATIMGEWAEDSIANILVPVLLMGVPIFDMVMTTVDRFATGKVRTLVEWFEYAARDHTHHRLAALGIGRRAAVLVIWALTFYLGTSAIVLKEVSGLYALLILLQAGMMLLIITYFMIFVRNHQIRLFVAEAERKAGNGGENGLEEADLDRALNDADSSSSH